MKEIKLTQGKVALVDDCDYEDLIKYKWYAVKYKSSSTFYAVRHVNDRVLGMHRHILCVTDGKILVDHKNQNGLDNRRENIRLATHSQNQVNSKRKGVINSKHRGVYLNKRTGRFQAQIRKNGYCHTIGTFANQDEAAKAYNIKAIEMHGEFARLNLSV